MSLLTADTTIETERLVLRRVTRDDFDFYARIHADPDVARYLGHGKPRSDIETSCWMDTLLRCYRDHQLGQIAVTRKDDGALLGRTGVSRLDVELNPQADGTRRAYYYPTRAPGSAESTIEAELGYTFDRAVWGNGYAREAVLAIRRYIVTHRPELRVVSLIKADNVRSVRLATAFGATRVDRVAIFGLVQTRDRYVWPVHEAGN